MDKNKRILFFVLIGLDVAITVFLFVISIIMLANTVGKTTAEIINSAGDGLIGWLQNNPNIYLGVFVVPLFVLLAANIVGLVIYVRKQSKKAPVQVNDLTDDQKELVRQELLKDLQGDTTPKKEETPKSEE